MKMRVALASLTLVATAVLATAPSAGKMFEDVLKETLGTFDQITAALVTIKDEDSAKSAKPDREKAAGRFLEIQKLAAAMKPPDKAERDRLVKEYKPKLEEAHKKLFVEISRVRRVPGGRDALQAISIIVGPKEKK